MSYPSLLILSLSRVKPFLRQNFIRRPHKFNHHEENFLNRVSSIQKKKNIVRKE